MDVLEIEVVRRNDEPYEWEEAVVRVNGRLLIDLVKEAERPFAEREGNPSIAGAYAGIPATVALHPSRHLLDRPDELHSELVSTGLANKPALLMCECGAPGCWPFCARIDVEEGVVRWSDFEQPHRTSDQGRQVAWRYESLGPFVFDRAQYEAALQRPISPP